MAMIFSYGTLQQEDVQRSAFGRRLDGLSDELVGYERSSVGIDEPEVAARLGRARHANVIFTGNADSRVAGTAFEITDAELSAADEFEAAFSYERVPVMLASGRQAWVYVHANHVEETP
jgi:gamma-glutamylcyclotransferase (GGCT)/AIG2-like uncharacterized protein YtfP